MEYLDLTGLQTLWGRIKTNAASTTKSVITSTNSGTKKIDSTWLPSYVDDVLEYDVKENPPTGKTAFPATGEAGKIYVAKDTNVTYRWSGTQYTEISPTITLGTTGSTAYPGDQGAALNKKVTTIETEVLPTKADVASFKAAKNIVRNQIVDGSWIIYKNDGTTQAGTVSGNTCTIEQGYKAKFTGKWMWTHDDSYSDPTSTSGSWGTNLPTSGVKSASYTTAVLSSTTSGSQSVFCKLPKGAAVVNGRVVLDEVEKTDTKSASWSLNYKYGILYGCSTTRTITNEILGKLTKTLESSKSKTLTGVTAGDGEYFVYAYPKALGALTGITYNKANAVLSGFIQSTVTYTNAAGLEIDYYVYTAANAGAYTNAILQFS